MKGRLDIFVFGRPFSLWQRFKFQAVPAARVEFLLERRGALFFENAQLGPASSIIVGMA